MTIELVVDDCTHDIDIHFCSRCDARDLSANLRPMKCLAGVAARSRPGNEPLRFIICRPFIASDECARASCCHRRRIMRRFAAHRLNAPSNIMLFHSAPPSRVTGWTPEG
jgi:hypothetical protein